MLTANYHTHTWRCNHASGSEREYIETAIARGLKILGFSDHTPYPFPEGYESGFRMRMDQFDNYVYMVTKLRDEYKDDIEIRLGVECEYYPDYFDALCDFFKAYPVEYMLLGQHYLGSEIGDSYSGIPTFSAEKLRRYTDQVIAGMETGKFLYVAHPDLLYFTGPRKAYLPEAKRLCLKAKELGLPLEINCLGLSERRHYPNARFFDVAAKAGCDCIIGCDAHRTDFVAEPKSVEKAEEFARRLGLHVIGSLPIKKHF